MTYTPPLERAYLRAFLASCAVDAAENTAPGSPKHRRAERRFDQLAARYNALRLQKRKA